LIIPPNHLFNFSFFKGEGLCFQVFDISSWVTIVPCTQYSTCNNDHTLAVSILFFFAVRSSVGDSFEIVGIKKDCEQLFHTSPPLVVRGVFRSHRPAKDGGSSSKDSSSIMAYKKLVAVFDLVLNNTIWTLYYFDG
jgi:hypothetical protein